MPSLRPRELKRRSCAHSVRAALYLGSRMSLWMLAYLAGYVGPGWHALRHSRWLTGFAGHRRAV